MVDNRLTRPLAEALADVAPGWDDLVAAFVASPRGAALCRTIDARVAAGAEVYPARPLRALETLAGVDVIACEDTRITRRLTERYAISAELALYHEHNAAQARPKILERLAQGAAIALVSDAGTPLISDPGFKLVREVCAAGHAVIAVPGPSSVLTALSVAALPTDRFFFEGFLPAKEHARRARLNARRAELD